jgi:hypothetical protein
MNAMDRPLFRGEAGRPMRRAHVESTICYRLVFSVGVSGNGGRVGSPCPFRLSRMRSGPTQPRVARCLLYSKLGSDERRRAEGAREAVRDGRSGGTSRGRAVEGWLFPFHGEASRDLHDRSHQSPFRSRRRRRRAAATCPLATGSALPHRGWATLAPSWP